MTFEEETKVGKTPIAQETIKIEDDSKFQEELRQLKEDVIKDLLYQKQQTVRENVLYKKWMSVSQLPEDDIDEISKIMMNKEDIEKMINSDNNEVDLVLMTSTPGKKLWTMLNHRICLAENNHLFGRQLKYILYINGKIAGILGLVSDVSALSTRDKYVGWTREVRMNGRKLQNILNGGRIVPTQPFGYYCAGGKLLTLLMMSAQVKNDYETTYNDKLVAVVTTSLYGSFSQYSGLKYFKSIGETKGARGISVINENVTKIRRFLNKYNKEEYEKANKASGPKLTVLELFYKKYGINKALKEMDVSTNMEFHRGTFFAELYENTLPYLRNEIGDDKLKPKKFDYGTEINEIFEYWKNKFAIKRYNNVKDEVREVFIVKSTDTFEQFVEKYM